MNIHAPFSELRSPDDRIKYTIRPYGRVPSVTNSSFQGTSTPNIMRRIIFLLLLTASFSAQAQNMDPIATRTMGMKAILGYFNLWWDDEPEDLREDLRDELRGSHGIPQEVDRHMLLRVRRALDRPLSFPEKKILREMVRTTVLGASEESVSA